MEMEIINLQRFEFKETLKIKVKNVAGLYILLILLQQLSSLYDSNMPDNIRGRS